MTRQYFNPSKWRTNLDTPCSALAPCVRCRELLPITSFYSMKRGRQTIVGDFRGSVCKSCALQQYRDLDPRAKLYYNAKKRAGDIGVPFDLTLDDIVIPEHCPALGLEIRDYTGCGKPDFHKHHDAATLDRVDNSKGYVANNIQVICKRANLLKKDATISEIAGVLAYMLERSDGAHGMSDAFLHDLRRLALQSNQPTKQEH